MYLSTLIFSWLIYNNTISPFVHLLCFCLRDLRSENINSIRVMNKRQPVITTATDCMKEENP